MGGQRGKRVTAADVARSLNISRATVGFVLNNTPGQTISDNTRKRVLAEAARLGYRPHRAAQDLRRGSSKVVLVVLPDWATAFRMREHLEEALDEAGFSLATQTQQAGRRARPLWELLTPEVVVGLVPFDSEDLASLRACGITKILPDLEDLPDPTDWPAIRHGPVLQIKHLHELGHRRIAYAATSEPRSSLLMDARLRVTQRAAARLGLDPLDVRSVDHRDGSARDAVRRWREMGVSGVVGYNDDAAAMVIGAAIREGMSVPGDLAVIGHDDIPLAAAVVPSISSVHVDTVGLGRHFAAMALHAAAGQPPPARDYDADMTVVPRESTVMQ